jgi:integrase
MTREREGSILKRDGKIYARVQYTTADGRRTAVWRKAQNRTHARDLIRQIKRELEERGESSIRSARMTFNELADYYSDHYLKPAEYRDGRKVSGLRSLATPLGQLNTLRQCFGRKYLRSITYGDLRAFRDSRLKTPTRSGGPRALASVHRELALLRRMISVAVREGWIINDPFRRGESLISLVNERRRERILSYEEEIRLLSACGNPRRQHLRAFIIAACDTGCRKGELLSLRWCDVDFEGNRLIIHAANTKTLRARDVPLSTRAAQELRCLRLDASEDHEGLVFGQKDVKRSFASARKEAGLPDVRVHDLRHTFASRLARGHLPVAEIARTLGHATLEMSYRYINTDNTTLSRARNIIDAFHDGGSQTLLPVFPDSDK